MRFLTIPSLPSIPIARSAPNRIRPTATPPQGAATQKRFMNKRFQSYPLRYEIPRQNRFSPENRKKHSETLSPVRKAKAPTSLSNTHTKNNGLCQKCKETQSHTSTNHSGCVKQLCNSVHKTLTAAYGAASHHVQNHLFSVSKLFRIGPPGARHA